MKKINESIEAKRVNLIGVDGSNMGVFLVADAIRKASEYGYDLVQMSNDETPACKIMDYQKEQYKLKKKTKKRHTPTTKKLAFRPNTGEHDLTRMINQAQKFLDNNDNVVFIVKFKGREVSCAYKALESFNVIESTLKIPSGYGIKKDTVVNNNKMHFIINK